MLTFQSLAKTGSFNASPNREQRRNRMGSTSSFGSMDAGEDARCDCDSYRSYSMACPCSARHAANTGKRATDRILNKSKFFDSIFFGAGNSENEICLTVNETETLVTEGGTPTTVLDPPSLYVQTSAPSHKNTDSERLLLSSLEGADLVNTPNLIAELDPTQVEVRDLLGKGGFCEVHTARLVKLKSSSDTSGDKVTNNGFVQNAASHDGALKDESSVLDHEQVILRAQQTISPASSIDVSSTKASKETENENSSHHSANQQDAQEQVVMLEKKEREESQKGVQLLIESQQDYCIKFLKPSVLVDRKKFARGTADLAIEAHFLSVLKHPHILRLRGVTQGFKLFQPKSPQFLSNLSHHAGREGCLFLLLDKLSDTLDHRISDTWKAALKKSKGIFHGQKRRLLKVEPIIAAIQLAEAIQYLHSHNIVYRDLKPDNVGFCKNNTVKLFDFGLVKELKAHRRHLDGTYLLSGNTGSRRYMAPEVASHKKYNLSVDVYSFGILLWEMCTLEKPFDGFTEMQHTNLVVHGGHRPRMAQVKSSWPEEVRTLIKECWQADLHKRPNFVEIIESLKGIYKILMKGKDYVSV